MDTPATGSMASTAGGGGRWRPGSPGAHAAGLPARTTGYPDTGGSGPVIVLLHGLMRDASAWDGVAAGLAADYRCVAPTLPSGAHRHPMKAGADLSLPGTAGLVTEFPDRLDLREVTLVGNDTGGAIVQLIAGDGPARVERNSPEPGHRPSTPIPPSCAASSATSTTGWSHCVRLAHRAASRAPSMDSYQFSGFGCCGARILASSVWQEGNQSAVLRP
jgi:hypothetical protein